MVITDKFIFIHLEKTGGTFVTRQLRHLEKLLIEDTFTYKFHPLVMIARLHMIIARGLLARNRKLAQLTTKYFTTYLERYINREIRLRSSWVFEVDNANHIPLSNIDKMQVQNKKIMSCRKNPFDLAVSAYFYCHYKDCTWA